MTATPQPPELTLETMLLATDWSEGAERLHAQAASIARLFGTEVVVVTAFDPPGPLRIKRGAQGLTSTAGSSRRRPRRSPPRSPRS